MEKRSGETLGYIKIAVAAIIWGSVSLLVRALDLPVLLMVFYRFLFAVAAALSVLVFSRAPFKIRTGKNLSLLILSGFFLTLNWVFFFYALVLTTVANAPLLGIIFAFGTSLTYASLVIIAKELLTSLPVLIIIFYQSLIAMVALSPFSLLGGGPRGFEAWLLLIIMGIVHTLIAPYLYLSGLKVVKAQRAGIITYFDPLSATAFAALFLGEIPTFATIVGGLLIIAGGYNIIRKSG